MNRTEWIELSRLRTKNEAWYKRRIYGDGLSCSGCGAKKKLGRAFYQYAWMDVEGDNSTGDSLVKWEGGIYCNRKCLPEDLLLRYNLQNRLSRDPSRGELGKARHSRYMERLRELRDRYEGMGKVRGSITALAMERGISRQRVYQLLEKVYGRGNVPVLPAASKSPPTTQDSTQ